MKVTITGRTDCMVATISPESVEEELLLKFFDKNRGNGSQWGLVCADLDGKIINTVNPKD